MNRLVCVSNRISLPGNGATSGGLAVGLLAAMGHTGGVWFGWSGEASAAPTEEPQVLTDGNIKFATIDLTVAQIEEYYNGYCNGALWPLFHYNPELFRHEQRHYDAYQSVNALFARQLLKLVEPGDAIWVHDYHLIPLARYLRQHQFEGRIGFFLHTPFPHIQMLRLLPNHAELIRDLCQYDLAGFQTTDDVRSFRSCLEAGGSPARGSGAMTEPLVCRARTGTYPIGVDVKAVAGEATEAVLEDSVARMTASLLGRKLIIGVDRLDYSKGLMERFAAFEHFLESFPDNQGKVTFLQIAPLSRSDVLAYSEIRQALEQSAGRLNGRFAEADWTPIRYLNRNFSHATTMGFLRAAQVALVTPVRDGMNLVAKEFVAAQDPKDPGVLIISPLAGAARELASGALQVNPYDKRGMALALQNALHMPLEERRQRHREMLGALRRNDIHHWYGEFCRDLDSAPPASTETTLSVRLGGRTVTPPGWWRRTVGRLFSSKASP